MKNEKTLAECRKIQEEERLQRLARRLREIDRKDRLADQGLIEMTIPMQRDV